MLRTGIINIIACIAFFSLSGCDQNQADMVKKVNTIEFLDIQPPANDVFTHDQDIVLKITVGYKLKSKAATLALAVLDTEGLGNKSVTSSYAVIQQGEGEQVLQGRFIVPNKVKVIKLRIPLMPQQHQDSAPVLTHTYKVVSADAK